MAGEHQYEEDRERHPGADVKNGREDEEQGERYKAAQYMKHGVFHGDGNFRRSASMSRLVKNGPTGMASCSSNGETR